MELLRRYTVIILFINIVSIILTSAKQCGNMSCDRNGGDAECYLIYPFRGTWYYQSKYAVRQGLANIGGSNSCYKFVVKRNMLTTSCLDTEKLCAESGGYPAVINSYQEYVNYNEFILDVTRVETFDPVFRKLLVQVDHLPMSGLNKTCSQVLVKDGLLTDNGGYILTQPCAEKVVVNSILCEYSSTRTAIDEPICGTTPPTTTTTVTLTTSSKPTTTVAMEIVNMNTTTPMSSTVYPTPNRDVADDRKNIGLAATTVTIIGLLVAIITLLTCMLLYVGKMKHNRKRERYVVRAHHAIRSVHLYDSPLDDDWMDKPYLVPSQKQTLYSNSDSTNSTMLSDVTHDDTDTDQCSTTSNPPSSNGYENHYAPICREHPEYVYSSRNQQQFKEYYNVELTKLETVDGDIIKRIYNPLRAQPDHLEIESGVNENRPTKQPVNASANENMNKPHVKYTTRPNENVHNEPLVQFTRPNEQHTPPPKPPVKYPGTNRPTKPPVKYTSNNENRPTKPVKYSYDKLSRSTNAMMSMPNQYKPRSNGATMPFRITAKPSNNAKDGVQYAPPGAVKTGYHHLERRCATLGSGRSRNEHDYARLVSDNTT